MSRTKRDGMSYLKRIPWRCGSGIPSWFKRMRRRRRRAKEDDAIRSEKEVPTFKRSDSYDWW